MSTSMFTQKGGTGDVRAMHGKPCRFMSFACRSSIVTSISAGVPLHRCNFNWPAACPDKNTFGRTASNFTSLYSQRRFKYCTCDRTYITVSIFSSTRSGNRIGQLCRFESTLNHDLIKGLTRAFSHEQTSYPKSYYTATSGNSTSLACGHHL